jgi:hypothetical protein
MALALGIGPHTQTSTTHRVDPFIDKCKILILTLILTLILILILGFGWYLMHTI